MDILGKLDKKTRWTIPFYFQFFHAVGIFAGSFIISLWATEISFLKEYQMITWIIIWAIFILITSKFSVRNWRKGFLISTAILLAINTINFIRT